MFIKNKVELIHGSGGRAMNELIDFLIVKKVKLGNVFGGIGLKDMDDGASIPLGDLELVFTSDSYTVEPLFFPGGNIGVLAACGTINDLAVMGAKPLALMDSIIVEEGFPISKLNEIIESLVEVTSMNNVAIVGGDFKVMPKGKMDKIIISTSGIGIAKKNSIITDSGLKPGNKIIVTGTIGEHELSLISVREGLSFESPIASDVAPIWPLIEASMKIGGLRAAKDPTRGGLAAALNEMARKSNVSIWIYEENIPIKPEVKAACEMLGLDPLYLACEGRAILGVDCERADEILKAIRNFEIARTSAIIGEVRSENPGYVVLETSIGGKRILESPVGMPLPRIC
ncbi:MAG: hydrogenase expression/formation protein HypE [archaeon GB-1845-036]|nr:hydrogenase expression/formation protein HypE [Candidatus Culexmicrobium thermophilum]HDO20608.1 hydrogenase expression/formation protein HypE [Candidatus Bathyarchaeota archaeon]